MPDYRDAQVIAVVDGGVHSGATARRHAVRGVADEERAVLCATELLRLGLSRADVV